MQFFLYSNVNNWTLLIKKQSKIKKKKNASKLLALQEKKYEAH